MNTLKKSLLFLAALLIHGPAHAGIEKGNGGDVVVCQGKSPQLLDYFEAESRWKLTLKSGIGSNEWERATSLIDRLVGVNPRRAKVYKQWLAELRADSDFVRGIELIDIPDSGDGFIPAGCSIRQVAVQRSARFPGEKRYTFNRDLFDLMSVDDRAGLFLHELILREASEHRGQENSINTRYLNSQISSGLVSRMSPMEYAALILLTGMKVIDVNQYSQDISSCDPEILKRSRSLPLSCGKDPSYQDLMGSVRLVGADFSPRRGGQSILFDRYADVQQWNVDLRENERVAVMQFGNAKVTILRKDTPPPPNRDSENREGIFIATDRKSGMPVRIHASNDFDIELSTFNCKRGRFVGEFSPKGTELFFDTSGLLSYAHSYKYEELQAACMSN